MGTYGTRSKNSLLVLTVSSVWSLACVMAVALIEGHAAGQCVEQKLLPSDGAASDLFGISLSIKGDVAVVGARENGDNGVDTGSVYIYRNNGTNWVQETKLLPSDGAAGDWFGNSVSISGEPGDEVIIVGAPGDNSGTNSGSVYFFRYLPDLPGWNEEAKFIASDSAAGDRFGNSVSISGPSGNEIAIVGAHMDADNGPDSGSAYIYRKSGENWVEEQKLLPLDGAAGDLFGVRVSISSHPGNEVVIVGAHGDDDSGTVSGSAYIYRFNPGLPGWIQEAKLLASDSASGDQFGGSVSISGPPGNEVVIVGAWRNDDRGTDTGSAYIYRFNGVSWLEEQKLLASDGAEGDAFGVSVLISSDSGNEVAILGAFWDDDNGFNSGSAYIFRKTGVSWVQEQKLLASDGAFQDWFGLGSVSISGPPGNEIAIVGALFNDDNGTDSGSVYIFELAACPADTNCSGDVNVFDLLQLLGNWGSCPVPCPPDTNSDGIVNVTDLLSLLAAWGPCPVP